VFFRPVFNIADAAISGGVFAILIFQNRFFPAPPAAETKTDTEAAAAE
jgi:signal peptidase II